MHDPSREGRMLDKLIREIARSEQQAMEHASREAARLGPGGDDAPPVVALRAVADHATAMRPRFFQVLSGHELRSQRTGFGATLATLRHLVVDRIVDPERSFRTALLDLRHGMEIVKLLREVARRDILFGVIRWCDDWLGARRTLVARVEAQLPWFAEHAGVAIGIDPAPSSIAPSTEPTETPSTPRDGDEWHTDRTIRDRHDLGFETDVGIDRL